VKDTRLKRVHAVGFHLYKLEKQAKLIYGIKSQYSGYLWGEGKWEGA